MAIFQDCFHILVSGLTKNTSIRSLHLKGMSKILLRGIQLTNVQRYWGSTVKMVCSCKIFTFYEANTCVALTNAWRRSVRALS
jgi:hypothetical protein